MEAKTNNPEKTYPYLCIWNGAGDPLNDTQIEALPASDLMVMSKIQKPGGPEDFVLYLSYLIGGKAGYETAKESDYFRLPKGFEVKLIQ